MTGAGVLLVGLLVALVAALFVLAMAEASLLRVRRSAVVVAAQHGDRRAAVLLDLIDDLPRVMNAVLLAVLLAQMTAATVAGALARDRFGNTGVTLATVLVSLVIFVYGEAIPKTIAVRSPFVVSRLLARSTRALALMLRPFVSVLVRFADAQSPGRGVTTVTAVSEEELLHLAEEAATAGQIDRADAELIDRSFSFGDCRIGDVLIELREVVGVPVDADVSSALRLAVESGHRRLPVFKDNLESITGFVRLRDLANATSAGSGTIVADHRRNVLRVAESELAVDVLRSMQATGIHLAVVFDDARATTGIVTVEDVVEELVGSIEDREPPSQVSD